MKWQHTLREANVGMLISLCEEGRGKHGIHLLGQCGILLAEAADSG